MSRCLFLLLASVIAIAPNRPAAQPNALFTFQSNPWLNLHHFVRVSARGGPTPTGLSEEEGRQWAAGVEFITTREFKKHGIAYTEYAGQDLYTNLCGAGCREKIAEYWTPRLEGKRSIADSLSALVASFK